ncbi:MAG: RagB/SusD family nutrient uptake outer membrane protein [Muribaculaceae bacterium]|nr:RagB/SusD family nutrient uptake outer membrane protein [Muribaculaceae bacterium]
MLTKASKYMMMAAMTAMTAGLSSCNSWLGEDSPGSTKLDDFFVNGTACEQTINGCYNPLMWEYNTTYYSEWFIGDVASDDALKGGQNLADMAAAYDIENFKTNANNEICLDYYRAKYQGIIRCNLALREVAKYEPDETLSQERKDCMLGEAYFLRGLYYFQLVRVFGGVPLVHDVLDSSEKWIQPRATAEQVYESIISDLVKAEEMLFIRSQYAEEDLGRATKAAAQALLCKVYLYMHDYDNAYTWGKKFVDDQYRTGRYSLVSDYISNFTTYGENGPESVFEIQYAADPTSDYGEGNGFTRGTFSTILTRPRLSSLGGNSGWGFNHPTRNLYNEFETGDPRRDFTIGMPDEADLQSIDVTYLGSPYYNKKTSYIENGTFIALDHATRSPLNYRLIRVSDVLLLYAEAALESGKNPSDAKWALEEVRKRARALTADPATMLPAFPNYRGYKDDTESLRQAIRHERRVELAMEGHRWFDLVRWGIAYEVMDKDAGSYGSTESDEARAEMANFIKGKHELLPIPSEERILNPMEQNPGY